MYPASRGLSPVNHHLYNTTVLYSTVFFDLDETLYAKGNGLWNAIGNRMNQYMVEKLGMPEEQISKIRQNYFEEFGTTLRGLQYHHDVDAVEYLNFVHDLPLDQFLTPDPELKRLLSNIHPSGWIFTNSDVGHASRVIKALGLDECFKGIIDIYALDYFCKPNLEAYQKALEIAGQPEPETCLILDDSLANLKTANNMGMTTVLVGTNINPSSEVHFAINSLHDLPSLIPQLWEDEI